MRATRARLHSVSTVSAHPQDMACDDSEFLSFLTSIEHLAPEFAMAEELQLDSLDYDEPLGALLGSPLSANSSHTSCVSAAACAPGAPFLLIPSSRKLVAHTDAAKMWRSCLKFDVSFRPKVARYIRSGPRAAVATLLMQ